MLSNQSAPRKPRPDDYAVALAELIDSAADAWLPDPYMTVSQWADQNRVLSTVASKEPGQWRTTRAPYTREPMNRFSTRDPIERVVLKWGAQTAKTETLLNAIGYMIDCAPGPAMMLLPSDDTIRRVMRTRIDPLINFSPSLFEKVPEQKGREPGNTMWMKEFPGGVLAMSSASSAADLRSMPIRWLFADEVDAYGLDVQSEGDPLDLAIQRTATFSNRKIGITSTPGEEDLSRIEKAFQEGDQRHFYVPCPACGVTQWLKWSNLKWEKGKRYAPWYECEGCHERLHESEKTWMLEHGEWIPHAKGDGRTTSYFLNSLYSPLGWLSWASIAIEHGNVYKDSPRLKTFVNTKLAEVWRGQGDRPDRKKLVDRREEFTAKLPAGVAVLTAGVDVQDDRLEVEVIGWGQDEESWSIAYEQLWGDPSGNDVWEQLETLLLRAWPHTRAVPPMRIKAACIDSGGHHTLAVYRFCKRRVDRRVWPIKGSGGFGKPVWPRKASSKNKGRVPLYIVGVDAVKEALYQRLAIEEPGPGYLHFPMDRDADYFDGLTAEQRRVKFIKGRKIVEWYKKDSARNEPLDCRVYGTAALYGLISLGLSLNREAKSIGLASIPAGPEDEGSMPLQPPPRKKPRAGRRVIRNKSIDGLR